MASCTSFLSFTCLPCSPVVFSLARRTAILQFHIRSRIHTSGGLVSGFVGLRSRISSQQKGGTSAKFFWGSLGGARRQQTQLCFLHFFRCETSALPGHLRPCSRLNFRQIDGTFESAEGGNLCGFFWGSLERAPCRSKAHLSQQKGGTSAAFSGSVWRARCAREPRLFFSEVSSQVCPTLAELMARGPSSCPGWHSSMTSAHRRLLTWRRSLKVHLTCRRASVMITLSESVQPQSTRGSP